MENNWRVYFTFTKKERQGILFLLILIAVITALPWFFTGSNDISKASLDQYQQQLSTLLATTENDSGHAVTTYKKRDNIHVVTLVAFDPNTLDSLGWKKLGLRDRTIHTIRNYLSKGGRFRKPADLATIYGLRKEEYELLLPYVQIAEVPHTREQKIASFATTEKKYVKPALTIIDINVADTTDFIVLPGIGSKLANRIINFRDKLGGFYSVSQVGETWGLPDSTFQQIRGYLQCPSAGIRLININTADVNTLRQHPYIKWNIANAIVQYRAQHGRYTAVAEIQQIAVITIEIFQKIAPYLAVE